MFCSVGVANAQLDNHWTVSVLGQTVPVNNDGSFVISNISAPDQFGPGGPGTLPDFVGDDFVRVRAVRVVGGVNQYAFGEFFQVRQGQRIRIADLTFTDIPPRQPERISILENSGPVPVGGARRLRVMARYSDGTTNEITSRTAWTTYRVSNPAVAVVSVDGEVAGKLPGTVFVTAMNEGASAVARVRVASDLSVTSVHGKAVDGSGFGLSGVQVTVVGTDLSALSGPDGTFEVGGVPADRPTVAVIAQVTRDARRWLATADATTVPGGVTDVGTLVLSPFQPRAGWMAAGGNPHRGTRSTDQGAHTLALKENHSVWAWGYNLFGQVGVGTQGTGARAYLRPVPVALLDCQQVAVGGAISHSLALLKDGSLYGWGRNDHGQLGRGNTRNHNEPQPVPGRWSYIAAGGCQSAGIDDDGVLWRWGEFTGRGSDHTSPQRWNEAKRWASVALGYRHLVGLTAEGELWSWQDEESGGGRLGQNTNWTFVAAGGRHSLALQADGSLWAWGANEVGQLGNDTTVATNEPVQVSEPGPWSFVAAGEDHTLAIKADGTLWCWGGNGASQFGDGTRVGSTRPVNKLPGNDWVAVAAGYQHSFGLKANGSLCAWGRNEFGQLGLGTMTEEPFPKVVESSQRWSP
ncbi:MAG TPA: hypothetical protein PLX89_10245 [Verrucomicrobiota bacterium]|nr:hypothetical protein [Verrucomicrobiota bacterium]